MGKTIHERDAKVTAFKPAPLSPVACGIDTSCLQNSLKSRRGSAGVPARDIRICMYNKVAACVHVQHRCTQKVYSSFSCLPISAYSSDVTFAIPESGFKIKIHGVRIRAVSLCTIGLAWMYRRLDYILHDYNYELEPCCTVLPDRLQPAGYRVVR